MRTQATSLYRWTWTHRHQLFVAGALTIVAATLLFATPFLLLFTLAERTADRKKPLALGALVLGVHALTWLVRDLTGQPQGPWHPCAQCGQPILEPSRAAYCSHACRTYARLERDAEANDPRIADRAQRRLRANRLRQLADENADWAEIPF